METATQGSRAPRQRAAKIVDATLPLAGVVVVLTAVVIGGGGWVPVWLAVTGLLLVEAGVWRLGSRMLHERRYLPLREEVTRFVGLARALHHASAAVRATDTPATREALEATVAAMRTSLDRMVSVAGKTTADLEAEGASEPTARVAAV